MVALTGYKNFIRKVEQKEPQQDQGQEPSYTYQAELSDEEVSELLDELFEELL
jgi:uncharacterized membrane protein YqhA